MGGVGWRWFVEADQIAVRRQCFSENAGSEGNVARRCSSTCIRSPEVRLGYPLPDLVDDLPLLHATGPGCPRVDCARGSPLIKWIPSLWRMLKGQMINGSFDG